MNLYRIPVGISDFTEIREHGESRSDIVVKDVRGGRIAIFEVKYARAASQLECACDAALG